MMWNRSRDRLAVILALCVIGLTCGRENAVEADVPEGVETKAVAMALPAGAQLVVSGYDLESFWSRLKSTRLYGELTAIEGASDGLAEMQSKFLAETGLPLDETTVLSVFGRKFDFGFYGPLSDDHADLALIAEVQDEGRVREILAAVEQQVTEEEGATFRDIDYEGTTVRVATSPEGQDVLFHALVDKRLVMSTTESRFKETLDLAADRGAGSTMGDNQDYMTVLGKLPASDIVVFVDQRAMQETAIRAAEEQAGMEPWEAERVRAATTAFQGFNYARAFAAGAYWTDAGIRSANYILLEPGPRRGFARIMGASSEPARTLDLQPTATLLYFALNTLVPDAIYEELLSFAINATRVQMDVVGKPDSLRANEAVAGKIAEFESNVRISIEEDILSWFDDEASLSITGVDRTGFFPLPEVSIVLTSKDAVRARTLFGKLETLLADAARARASIPVVWQSEEYAGNTIRYAPTPVAQVAYVVTDEFAIIGSSNGLVKRMLDAQNGQAEALPASAPYQALGDFYTEDVSGIGYIDLERTLTEVESLLETFGPMAGGAVADSMSTGRQVLRAFKNAPRMGFYNEAEEEGFRGHLLLEVQ
jgi:hypothetical protein